MIFSFGFRAPFGHPGHGRGRDFSPQPLFRYPFSLIDLPNRYLLSTENPLFLPGWTMWAIWSVIGGSLKRDTIVSGQ